jgi:hypothetical protein
MEWGEWEDDEEEEEWNGEEGEWNNEDGWGCGVRRR